MVRRPVFFFLALLALLALAAPRAAAEDAYLAELVGRARALRLAERPEWLRLLHYRRRWWGRAESLADGRKFFLARRGKTRPGDELEATLAVFFAPEPDLPEEMHPQCRFPARYAWLKEQLAFDPARLPERPCARFEEWRANVAGRRVTAVFASAYMNNPASLYGHTFLRVGPAAGDRAALNDYSVNFAAQTDDTNGIAFAVKGLLGLYPGMFSVSPYYMQVQKYNNIESRDLWEYDLALTPEQTERMMRHLWELGTTYFDYFFLTENCSFQLLPLLEVADPALDVSRGFRFKAIPADTIRAVASQPGLVVARERRPSQMRLVLARRARLDAEELRAAERIGRRREGPPFPSLDAFPPERRALVIDTAYDYFRFLHGFKRFQSPEIDEYERELLLRRSRLDVPSEGPPSAVDSEPPENGHKSGRIAVTGGVMRRSGFEELSLRPALHDLLSDPAGYVPNSELEMFHLVLRHHDDRGKFYVERLGLMDIVSLAPLERWVKRPSWKLSFGLDNARDLGRAPEKGLAFRLNAGGGPALRAGDGATLYAMGETDLGVGGIFRKNGRWGAGALAGALVTLTPRWRLIVEGGERRYFAGDVRWTTRLRAEQSYTLRKNSELRLGFTRENRAKEGTLTLALYL